MIRILFCNISYLPYYNTRLDRVAPKNGGAYVAKMHDAYEKHNFEECADGQYRGFVETKYRIGYEEGIATNTYNSLHIERIDPFAKGKTYLDDVLVVFCAKPENGQTVIVGMQLYLGADHFTMVDFSTSKQIEKMDFYCRKIKEHLLFHEQGKTELALDKQIFGMLVHQNAASMSIKLFVT